jgi:hypothetical protein
MSISPCFRGVQPLKLATRRNSLARDSRRIWQRRSAAPVLNPRGLFLRAASILSRRQRLLQRGFMHFSRPFRDAFHLSLMLLMRYRSRVVFRLGCWYHPYSDAKTRAPYSGTRSSLPPTCAYGVITLYDQAFQDCSASAG